MSTENKYEFKGTKGEWTLGDENNYSCEVCIGETVASLVRDTKMSERYIISREEMLSNAHLIAAAPELLQACIHMVEYDDRGRALGEPRISETWYNEMKRAINKALNLNP
jgi:hypothetical protein